MLTARLPLSAARENLQRLVGIRLVFVVGLAGWVAYARYNQSGNYSYEAVAAVISLILIAGLLSIVRLRWRWPVTDPEYFAQLCFDALALTAVLYFSGGATNPFISCFLVLLTVSAATLPGRYTYVFAALTILAYSSLLWLDNSMEQGMEMSAGGEDMMFSQHIQGMWLTFVISAVLISYLVVRMAQAIRIQDQKISEQREYTLQDEQLLAIATLAAGTAHELGTPLATLSLLLEETRAQVTDPDLLQDLQLMSAQVRQCRDALNTLRSKHELSHLSQPVQRLWLEYINELVDRWALTRPDVVSDVTLQTQGQTPSVLVDETLSLAILNLLNNAADASPDQVNISINWDDKQVFLSIRDHGDGIPLELADQLGKPFVTSKHEGLGLGLFLTHTTVSRFQGQLRCYNHADGGMLTELQLPVLQGTQ